jgi:hypothetical protein
MSGVDAVDDPLAGWDPRRRAALEDLWELLARQPHSPNLSEELIAERRLEAEAEDR